MTKPARIRQSDIDRAVRAVRRSGMPGRVEMDLAREKLVIIIGEPESQSAVGGDDGWDDEDGD